ncbi:hypothetical protein CJF42_19525 [Pseudoalteromonas sp. NBT06-2]|uniref:GreA/GreB family elongation factor n=1 Tax=Pseudoalteromonas sp. NBT06-2 TaxID=2025950 RepID=UPI000BA6A896|nr:GreA/GreB family elongation factor [Pseudoalteromonas sp. NBT06-2]PAJ72745.1 hypothetical protein CJF42_19525 [Pseudoalteromonas sp. NBT06-2]
MDKLQLISKIIKHLEKELKNAILAANNARDAAVNDESVAETQYDTIAIEAGYLAQGQSKRVDEFETAIKAFHILKTQKHVIDEFETDTPINVGHLVQLEKDQAKTHWFFIAAFAGGFVTQLEQHKITVITPKSPIGQALVGKYQDDEIKVNLGSMVLEDVIFSVL